MYQISALRVLGGLAFYAAIFVVIRLNRARIAPVERKTFIAIGLSWAVPVCLINYLLYRADLMSFLPWVTNFMHTFVWIGFCLSWLYLSVRDSHSMVTQIVLFTTFSLIVKYAEHILFGTWDHDHFFHVFEGNGAYIMGWSIADGLYPPITLFGLRLAARRIPGLVAT